jgi:hypothetical protein
MINSFIMYILKKKDGVAADMGVDEAVDLVGGGGKCRWCRSGYWRWTVAADRWSVARVW